MRRPQWGRRGFLIIGILGALCLLNFPAFAASTTTKVDLLLSAASAKPGDAITAGIRLKLKPGWHTYWRNPGDAGLQVKATWTLPAGITAGPFEWPVPEKLVEASLTGYIYNNEVILLVPIQIAATAAPGNYDLKAKIKWQECEKECLLGEIELSTPLTIGSESKPSGNSALLTDAQSRLPGSLDPATVSAHWEKGDKSRPLVIEWAAKDSPAEVDFFPYSNDDFDVKGDTERLKDDGGKIRLRKTVEPSDTKFPDKIQGLLVSRSSKSEPWKGYEVTLSVGSLRAEAPIPASGSQSLLVMLCFAFLGGLILNIMPCVLPVIALKVLSFVNQARETPGRVRQLGLVYGAGVLASFAILAGVAIAIQRAGELASWSSAFQNPQFRLLLTILITLVALNLFGVFEITLNSRALGAADQLAGKSGPSGAFFNGVLAAVLATPCTAPFLLGAVAFAFTQPPLTIILVFLTIGAGLAAPFVIVCWNPVWLGFLPKPGAWMQRFKVAMGFPMLATAVWLFWVTATRLGKTGVLSLGIFLVILAMAAWIWGEFFQRGSKGRAAAVMCSLALIAAGYFGILEGQLHWRSPSTASRDALAWLTWSHEAVAKARQEGHPVLVDFTADTCWTCQVNKLTSINIIRTREKLKELNAVTMEADFTDENAAIAEELKKYDRPGVPLVLVFPADPSQPAIVLPPVLTPDIVLDALNKAAASATATATARSGG